MTTENKPTREEILIIVDIMKRADKEGLLIFDRMTFIMDLENAHKQFRLRLNDFLNADDSNFQHDVLGIQQHINRQTKKLENLFVPRYAGYES